jgi:CubicO group peptidase (beta-lactamase class C family)
MKLVQPLPDMEKLTGTLSMRHSVPGLAYALIQGGKIIQAGASGIKNTQTGEQMKPDTMFEAASLTKTLFAVLVLRLADRGVLCLDQPVACLAPAVKVSEDARIDTVTVRQILSHGTGLPDWADKPLEFKFDPGTSFSYSGEGYYYLHKIVDQITGKDFTEHLNDEFFGPLGMKDSAALWDASVGKRMTNKFEKNGEMAPLRTFVDLCGNAPEPNAAWSLYSGAEDYAKFMLAILNDRAGLSDAAFEEMVKPQNKADARVSWGLGWGIPSKDPSILWHWGDNGGYRSFAAMDLESKDGFCVFCNSTGGTDLCIDFAGRLAGGDCWKDIAAFIETAE